MDFLNFEVFQLTAGIMWFYLIILEIVLGRPYVKAARALFLNLHIK
jgi:hypothetical protein